MSPSLLKTSPSLHVEAIMTKEERLLYLSLLLSKLVKCLSSTEAATTFNYWLARLLETFLGKPHGEYKLLFLTVITERFTRWTFSTCINYLPSSCAWSLELNLTSPKNSNTPTGIVYQLNLNLTSHNSERKMIYFKYLILFLSPPAQWLRFILLHEFIPVCFTVKPPGSRTIPPGPNFS